jgi:glycosyltransferase involved in cell wall biosynthesis
MVRDMQPLVSVVTPVYNGEKYLAECIESVLAQTYRNWDYCIVNNCSTDRTLKIAEHYASKDSRIRIHNNSEFVGSQENGNMAFRQIHADSTYCKVVHADDWLFPDCLTEMVELAEAHPTVGVVSAYRLTNTRIMIHALPYSKRVIPGREISRLTLLGLQTAFGSPTSMLIHADEVRKRPAFLNVANPRCDREACLDILRNRDFGFVHQMLTFSRSHSESETSRDRRRGSTLIGELEILTKYGREYLSEEEYNLMLKRHQDDYYDFLGSRVFGQNEKGFWGYHRNALSRFGQSLSRGMVAKAVCVRLLDRVLNPLDTARKLAKRFTQSLGRTTE